MGDVPIRPKPEPEPDPVAETIERVNAVYRYALTGSPTGAVRRKTLFLAAEVGIVAGLVADGLVGIVAGLVALIAVLLLALTDDTVLPA